MPKQKQLDALLRHAHRLEQQAQSRWLQARHSSQAAQAQLGELQAYAQEYSPSRVRGQQPAGALLNHQLFSERLKQAVLQQAQALHDAKTEEARQQEHWQHRYRRLEAMRLMNQRRLAERKVDQQRQEQRQLDELSCKGGLLNAGLSHA